MLELLLKRYYQRVLVEPVVALLKKRVTANQLTYLSMLLGTLVLPAALLQQTILAILLLLASGYCDTLDGPLARLTNSSSNWGAILDIMADRFVEFIVILALWSIMPDTRGLWCLLMLGSVLLCVTSFLVVGIFTANQSAKGFNYSPGLMERAEAFVFFIVMLLWPQHFDFLAGLFSFLVVLTAIIRLYQFREIMYKLQ